MRAYIPKTTILVALWCLISAGAMLITFLPVAVLAGLGQWAILRSRVPLRRVSAIPFALSFPVGQFPSYLMFLVASVNGVGGLDGPPEWFVAVSLASGGLLAGLGQFLGLPKSWRNFAIWIPATSLAWAVVALGDLPIKGMLVLSAVCSGLVTALAMLALSPWPSHEPERRPVEGFAGAHVGATPATTAHAAGLTNERRKNGDRGTAAPE
jgi:hypothetical protein